jgi:hypothetical protein
MEPNGDRVWTLAREPHGPLAAYLDAFARRFMSPDFQRLGLGQADSGRSQVQSLASDRGYRRGVL